MSLLRDPTRQGGVVPTLFCAGCSRQRSRCIAGTLAVRASAMVCCTYASALNADGSLRSFGAERDKHTSGEHYVRPGALA